MPHITEELWQKVKEFAAPGTLAESIMIADWPQPNAALDFSSEAEQIDFLQDIVTGVREKRAQHTISPSKELRLVLVIEGAKATETIKKIEKDIIAIGKIEELAIETHFSKKQGWVPIKLTTTLKFMKAFVYLGDVVDFEKEKKRIQKEQERMNGFIARLEGKLKNKNFVAKAPADVVEKEKKKLSDTRAALIKLEESLYEL
jgi:valyl-tRNA synthetase